MNATSGEMDGQPIGPIGGKRNREIRIAFVERGIADARPARGAP